MKYLTQEVLSVVINLSLTENIYLLFPTEIHFFCNHANKKICIDFTDDFVWVSISLRVQLYLLFFKALLTVKFQIAVETEFLSTTDVCDSMISCASWVCHVTGICFSVKMLLWNNNMTISISLKSKLLKPILHIMRRSWGRGVRGSDPPPAKFKSL